jgi:cell division protein FtsI/penicillin-binding protein 2
MVLAAEVRRGPLYDRNGEPIAVSDEGTRSRRYPLKDALGTLLGTHPSRVLLPPWALERLLDAQLRGYPERTDGPTVRQVGAGPRDAKLPWPDLRSFVPLLSLDDTERGEALKALNAAIESRSVRLSLDARLQSEVSLLLQGVLKQGRGRAAAAAVVDVETGQVLVRAQAPDLDPNERRWQDRLRAREPPFVARFTGAYGEWPDKTGLQGLYQSGSVGKVFTALAAARKGTEMTPGEGCAARGELDFECAQKDDDGPYFTRPGWPKPIHDHSNDPMHGRIEVAEALAQSCNVFFGQLGLALGPEPFVALSQAGAEVGYGGAALEPGPPGSRLLASTAFGQGAMVMNVVQAARLVAAVGSGGRYVRCPATMELSAPCQAHTLVEDSSVLRPILAGMRGTMTHGTGRGLAAPAGVRVYGKTGTADARGFAGEEPFGIRRKQIAPPHSWFVALAELTTTRECEPTAAGRIAIAVVVPRGGGGATTAGPVAMDILQAAQRLGYLSPQP